MIILGQFFDRIIAIIKDFFGFIMQLIQITMEEKYSASILITILAMLIRLLINKKVCALDIKKCIIEMPCEILVLSLGFVIANLNYESEISGINILMIVLILMVIDIALVNGLVKNVSHLEKRHIFISIFSYIVSIGAYALSIRELFIGG